MGSQGSTLTWERHCNRTDRIGDCTDPTQHDPLTTTDSHPNTLNENILWLALGPILSGISSNGTQPMFSSTNGGLPLAYTSTGPVPNSWTIAEIKKFIHVAIGAVAIESSTAFKDDHRPVTIHSTTYTKKLLTWRTFLLLVPFVVGLLCIAVLVFSVNLLHSRQHIPFMRLATLGNILQCCRTQYVWDRLAIHLNDWNRQSNLGDMQIMYGGVREMPSVLVGFAYQVLPFRPAGPRRCSTG